MKKMFLRRVFSKFKKYRQEIKKLKQQKQFLSTTVNDLRYTKRQQQRMLQELMLENAINERSVAEWSMASDS